MQYVYELGALCAIYVIAAVSLNMLQGTLGIMTIAQAGFMAIGGYSTAILTTHNITTFIPSIFVGIGLSSLVAVLLAWPVLSLSGFIYTIASFAVMLAITSLSTTLTITNGSYGIPGIPEAGIGGLALTSTESSAIAYLLLAALITFGFARLTRSHWGITMRAMRESSAAARSLGKPVVGITFGAYVFSASIASLAGSMYAAFTGYLDPTVFTVTTAFLLVAMVVIGGSGNVWAVAAGSLVISLLPNILTLMTPLSASIVGPATQVAYGLIVVACLLLRPRGLVPERNTRVKTGILRAVAGFASATGVPSGDQLRATRTTESDARTAEPETRTALLGAVAEPHGTLAVRETAAPALEVCSITKRFGGVQALSDVSFTLETSAVTGLLGANGAGKSTLLGIISGFIKPDSGSINLFGQDITRTSAAARANAGVVRTFQELRLFEALTTLENVIVGVQGVARVRTGLGLPRDVLRRAADLLEQLDLMQWANTRVKEISYGNRKSVAVARALATGARLLLVDEPFSGLTDREIERMCAIFRAAVSSGTTLLLVDHNAQAVTSFVDHLLVMDHGCVIADGSPAKVTADPVVIEAYFGRQVEAVDDEPTRGATG